MTDHRVTRWWTLGLLMSPSLLGLLAVGWGWISSANGSWQVRYGLVVWLVNDMQLFPNGRDSYSIRPLGLTAMAAISLAIMAVLAIGQRLHIRQALLRLRCPSCGYDLRGGRGRCPECGGPSPDLAQAGRLGRVHRPLVWSMVFFWTIPGLLLMLMMILIWRQPTSEVRWFGTASPFQPATAYNNLLGTSLNELAAERLVTTYCIVPMLFSISLSLFMLTRYRRSVDLPV